MVGCIWNNIFVQAWAFRKRVASYVQICKYICKQFISLSFSAWGHLYPRWTSWSADWECLLGALLSGAWHTARRADALRQNHRRRRRLLQHLLQRDRRREARSPSCVYRPGAYCRRLVHQWKFLSFCGVVLGGFCCSQNVFAARPIKLYFIATAWYPSNMHGGIIHLVVCWVVNLCLACWNFKNAWRAQQWQLG